MKRNEYDEQSRMRAAPDVQSLSSSSSSSSSYIDISRNYPHTGLRAFFTAPSERRKLRKRRSSRLLKLSNSSSSSINSDLAYGTGFIKRPKSRGVRSRKGKEIDRERHRDYNRERVDRDSREKGIGKERPGVERRATTDAEIIAVGAGLMKLARDQNKRDLKEAKNGRRPESIANQPSSNPYGGNSRGVGPSKVTHGPDTVDEDGWESASDAESEASIDSRLAFANDNGPSWFGFGKTRYKPQSRKSTIVDPAQFGPNNSLYGIVTEPVGLGSVTTWSSSTDFGQQTSISYGTGESVLPYFGPRVGPPENVLGTSQMPYYDPRVSAPVGLREGGPSNNTYYDQRGSVPVGPPESVTSGYSQQPLQHVYPIPTSDPSRYDVVRSSVVSGAETYVSSQTRPDPVPIQQPQPFTPVSQSVYDPSYSARSESGITKKSGRSKSLAEAALVGVAGAAIGAAIVSDRNDDRKVKRGDGRDRRNTESKDDKDDRRRERDREERKERHKKESKKDSGDDRREQKRERRREEGRSDDKGDRREKRGDDKRSDRYETVRHERSEDFSVRRTKSEASVYTTPIDPFQFQVADDAFATPTISTPSHGRVDSVPTVYTVDREPDFTRQRSSSIKDQQVVSRSVSRRDETEWDPKEQRYRRKDSLDRSLHDAEAIYQETKHFTAPIETAAVGAAIAAITTAEYRESRSDRDRRREERRGRTRSRSQDRPRSREPSRNDYDSRADKKEAPRQEPERDPIQEEADRAYREIVMARKIASQVIRSRSPSPDPSVVNKYEDDNEEPVIRIITPPGMEDRKKEGPYDAPNADFKLDYVLEDPRELRTFNILVIDVENSDAATPNLKRDPDAVLPRPHLNLVRPTPTPSPMPEKQEEVQAARSESNQPSKPKGETTSVVTDTVDESRGKDEPSPPSSTISKGVTWGENETKHYEVESPHEEKKEFVSSDFRARDVAEPEQPKPKPKLPTAGKGWGAIVAGITGASAAATAVGSSSDSSKTAHKEDSEKARNDNEVSSPYEYRGVIVEPEGPSRNREQRSPPSTGPKPSPAQSPHRVPGNFDDDLDFTATVAAGLQDTGFDPNIVINDPAFRRRDSPPGSNKPTIYQAPFAETVTDLGTVPLTDPPKDESRGFVLGEGPDTQQDWTSVSPDNEDTPARLSKKDQKKRDKALKMQGGDMTQAVEETPISKNLVEDYFEAPKLSKKEQKKRDKAAGRSGSQAEDVAPFDEPSVTRELVEEPESYFETPKKSKSKKSKKGSSTFDDNIDEIKSKKSKKGSDTIDVEAEDVSRDDRTVSVPVNAFEDLQNGEDDWNEPKKSKKKSKRDSERFDSPSRSVTSDIASPLERSSSKKSKDKSRRKSEQYEPEGEPTELSLPPSTPSENSRDGDFEDSRTSRKSSKRESTERDDSRSVVSADASRYDDDDYKKSKKKSRSSTKDDFDDTRSVASAPAGDGLESVKKSKKDKRSSGGFFGLFGSKPEPSKDGSKGAKDEFEEVSKKVRKSKRSSAGTDALGLYEENDGSRLVDNPSQVSSNGNGHKNGSHDYDDDYEDRPRAGDKKSSESRAESPSSKTDSFLAKAGTLGAGVGLAGAAVAIAAQHHQRSKADNAENTELPKSTSFDTSQQQYEMVDPEITERQFRPSIDPQYGDLLPLPPSDPVSPFVETTEYLPKLPDSRPDTPEADRIPRDRTTSSFRRSIQDTPAKSPSQSAVPLKFMMGNRSTPSSPGLSRSSPVQSPVTPRQTNLAFPRDRPRPKSWDSTKEYKPLYLVESNRRASVEHDEPEKILPSLPPSQRTSRSSSDLEFQDALEHHQWEPPKPLSIDTVHQSVQDFVDSQQSTPRAALFLRDAEESPPKADEDVFDEPLKEELPKARDHGDNGSWALAAATSATSVEHIASLPSHSNFKETDLDKLPSVPLAGRSPSLLAPMIKDRSSYLVQSSPFSRKFDDTEAISDSPTVYHAATFSCTEPSEILQDPNISHFSSQFQQPKEVLDSVPYTDDYKDVFNLTATTQYVDDKKSPVSREEVADFVASSSRDIESQNEFSSTKSKKDMEKDTQRRKGLSGQPTRQEFDSGGSSQDAPQNELADTAPLEATGTERLSKDANIKIPPDLPALVETDPTNEFPFTKPRKDKKKKGLSRSSTQDESTALEATPDIPEGEASANVEPTEEFSFTRSKKNKKRNKKGLSSTSTNDDITHPESSRGIIDEIAALSNSEPPDEFSFTTSKEDKKKRKSISHSSPQENIPILEDESEYLENIPIDRNMELAEPASSATFGKEEGEKVVQVLTDNILPVLHTGPQITGESPATDEVREPEESSSTKTKKDKKKDRKKGKSSVNWEPQEGEVASIIPQEPLLDAGEELSQENSTPDDSWLPTAKKSKKKDKKGKSGSSFDVEEVKPSIDINRDVSTENITKPVESLESEKLQELSTDGSREIIEETTPPEDFETMVRRIKDESEQSLPLEANADKDAVVTPLEDVAEEKWGEENIIVSEPKETKKQKSKSGITWNFAEDEEPASTQSLEMSDSVNEFEVQGSKKNKKKSKKSQKWTSEVVPESTKSLEKSQSLEELHHDPSLAETQFIPAPSSKKGKKKSKLSQAWDAEPEALEVPVHHESTIPDVTRNAIEDVAEYSGVYATPLSEEARKQPSQPSNVDQSKDIDMQQDLAEHALPENSQPTPDLPSTYATPMGATPWTATGGQPDSSSRDYFPSTVSLHSPLERQVSQESRNMGYFPSAANMLPFFPIGAAALGSEALSKNYSDHEDNRPPNTTTNDALLLQEQDVKTGAPDGLKAGYDNEQLRLARQLQLEFDFGSKKSKKDKKKRQSLPTAPDSENSGSRDGVTDLTNAPTRSRSLSIGPHASTERELDTPLNEERTSVYSAEQLELARQLKADFESGKDSNRKSKKDKKKRQTHVPEISMPEESAYSEPTEEPKSTAAEDLSVSKERDLAEDGFKADGFAAGYQEDQLSLARQLQAEFGSGSKTSKKGKKSRSTSRTPTREVEVPADYFGSASQEAPYPNDGKFYATTNIPDVGAVDTEPPRDGLAAGYKEDQLELARQLKEEFGSGFKKSKKDKKRQSMLRSVADDFSSPGDAPTYVDYLYDGPSTPVNEAEASKPVLDEPEDEFAFVSKKSKKDKRGKKRESLVPTNTATEIVTPDLSTKEDEVAAEVEAETTVDVDDGPTTSKKSKKDKKGKGRESIIPTTAESILLAGSTANVEEDDAQVDNLRAENLPDSAATVEDKFFVTRQSKKDKKGKKRESLLRSMTDGEISSQSFSEEAESTPKPPAFEQDPPEISSTKRPADPAEEEFAFETQESKDKGKQQGINTPGEYGDKEVGLAEEPLEEKSRALATEPQTEPVLVNDRELISKKDKKKRGSPFPPLSLVTSPDEPSEEVDSKPLWQIIQDVSEDKPTPPTPPLDSQEDEFEFTAKKSKKNKKNKRQSVQGTVPEDILDDIAGGSIAQAKSKEEDQPASLKVESEHLDSITPELPTQQDLAEYIPSGGIVDVPAGDMFGDFAFPTKKSKKDKKKRKDSLAVDSEQSSAVSTPYELVAEPAQVVEAQLPVGEPQVKSTVTKADPIASINYSVTPEDFTKEEVEQPEDDWGNFSIKKSKKDKKKRKSGLSTPAENPILEPTRVEEEHQPHELIQEKPVAEDPVPTTTTPQGQGSVEVVAKRDDEKSEGEWGTFSVKKSKKDKKKRKSDLSTPPETNPTDELTNIAAEDQLRELVQEGTTAENPVSTKMSRQDPEVGLVTTDEAEQPVDNWGDFSFKKSKKDKKRKSGLSTPAEHIIPNIVAEKQGLENEPIEPQADKDLDFMATIAAGLQDTGFDPNLVINNLSFRTSPTRQLAVDAEQPDEEWENFAAKASKKNKKRQRSSPSTPVEQPAFDAMSGFETGENKTNEPNTELFPSDSKIQPLELDRDSAGLNLENEATDDYFESATKSSKKNRKKNRKSGLSTPSEADALPAESQPEFSHNTVVENDATLLSEKGLISNSSVISQKDLPKETSLDEPMSKPIPIAQNIEPVKSDGNDTFSGVVELERKASKDKRKRQTRVDSTMSTGTVSGQVPLTSWADDVEEAEIERRDPVIEDIASDKALSIIPSATETTSVDDFIRPSKKGKKGKRRDSTPAEPSYAVDSFQSPKNVDTSVNTPVLAAAALAGAALVSQKLDIPVRKLSKKEKRKMSIDKRTPKDDMFDDPALWEGAEPQTFEELQDADRDSGSDGFWEPPSDDTHGITRDDTARNEDSKVEERAVDVDHSSKAEYVSQELEQYSERDVAKPAALYGKHSSMKEGQSHYLSESDPQWNDVPDEFIVTSSKKDKKKKKQSRAAAWEIPEEPLGSSYDSTSTIIASIIPDSTKDIANPPHKKFSFEDMLSNSQDHAFTASSSEGYHQSNRDLSFQDSPTTGHDSFARLSSFSHPGVSTLPVVREESRSPKPRGLEQDNLHSIHTYGTADHNRDSAFVSESPIPPPKPFIDEHIRDSGVHFRDFSPAEKVRTPAASTDDALARLSWPAVDEETETVDLDRSQRLRDHSSINVQDPHQPREDKVTAGYDPAFKPELLRQNKHEHIEVHTPRLQRDRSQSPIIHHEEVFSTPRDRRPSPLSHNRSASHHDGGIRKSEREHEDLAISRDSLPSQRHKAEHNSNLHQTQTIYKPSMPKSESIVKQHVQRIESPDFTQSQKLKEDKYADLHPAQRPRAEKPTGLSDHSMTAGAALIGASVGFAAARQSSRELRPGSVGSNRSTPNINRLRTPEHRPESVNSNRSSGTPPLRRSDRKSGDLRSLSQQSKSDLAKEAELAAIASSVVSTANPIANEGRVRAKDMADVYVS
jgi:hypothetical protein